MLHFKFDNAICRSMTALRCLIALVLPVLVGLAACGGGTAATAAAATLRYNSPGSGDDGECWSFMSSLMVGSFNRSKK